MWYPAAVTDQPDSEPVSLDTLKAVLHLDGTDDDVRRMFYLAAARDHVQKLTGLYLVTQTIAAKCNSFADLAHLPFAPIQSISSIQYVDPAGATQTLATGVYESRLDGLTNSIVLKYGQSWPAIQIGSRITVTAVVGYTSVPEAIQNAICMYAGGWLEFSEAVTMVDVKELPENAGAQAQLVNFRLNA